MYKFSVAIPTKANYEKSDLLKEFLNKINPKDYFYAHEAVKEFNLLTAAELYSKKWEQRKQAFCEIQKHLSQISNDAKAKKALNLTIPSLVHGLNDKLFSVNFLQTKNIDIFLREI